MTRTIAVIDDDPCVLRAFSRLLRAAEFNVVPFTSGEEFIASCSRPIPDCIVVDLHMPGLSAADIHQELVRAHLEIPMVLVTADTESQLCRDVFIASRAATLLRKPVDGPELLDCLTRLIATPAGFDARNSRFVAGSAR